MGTMRSVKNNIQAGAAMNDNHSKEVTKRAKSDVRVNGLVRMPQ